MLSDGDKIALWRPVTMKNYVKSDISVELFMYCPTPCTAPLHGPVKFLELVFKF